MSRWVCKPIGSAASRSGIEAPRVFLSTADQHNQEQDKHQDTKQDFEWLPDVFPRRWRIPITLLCLLDAVSNPSQEFSSLFNVELILQEGQIVQPLE
jgi:hypothetical protein